MGLLRRAVDEAAVAAYRALSFSPWLQRFALRHTQPLFLVGVLGLIRDEGGRCVVFHHTYRERYPWGLPGGWFKRGECPAEALKREVREESGLVVEPGDLVQVLVDDTGSYFEILLAARLVGGTFTPSAEVDRMLWVGPDQIPAQMKEIHRELLAARLRG